MRRARIWPYALFALAVHAGLLIYLLYPSDAEQELAVVTVDLVSGDSPGQLPNNARSPDQSRSARQTESVQQQESPPENRTDPESDAGSEPEPLTDSTAVPTKGLELPSEPLSEPPSETLVDPAPSKPKGQTATDSVADDVPDVSEALPQKPARKALEPGATQAGQGEAKSTNASNATKGEESGSASPAVANASGLDNPPPAYPARARRQGAEGTVLLRVLVSVQGLPDQVQIVSSSGHGLLDQAALDAVRQWRFKSAVRAGVTVPQWVEIPVTFRLD